MNKNEPVFLPHLKNSIPEEAFGYTVSMYSIALEGFRRGMELKFINKNRSRAQIVYSLIYDGNERTFSVTRGDAIPRSAIRACINKHVTKEHLIKAGVSTPQGEFFNDKNNDEDIINYAGDLGYPVVLKPSDGTGGSGVIANIKSENDFKEALSYVKYDLNYSELIVEKYAGGEDHRLYVIDEKVIAAFKKIPANVIGDGKNTIKSLLNKKNKIRTQTPALHNRPIKVDRETQNLLNSIGYTMDTIPKDGEQVFLKSKNNVSSGGDPIDTTDELTDEIKEIAINASRAIPGLVQCGVDMIVDETKTNGYVLEVNSRPHITAHLYPMQGKARDIPKAIIDYYFPDTKQPGYKNQPLYYFDIKPVLDAFVDGTSKEFMVPTIPHGNQQSIRFWLTGVLRGVNYEKWLRKRALDLKLNGYIKHLRNGKTSVVVSGSKESINKFKDIIRNDTSPKAQVFNVVEKNWKKPVKIGFHIIKHFKDSSSGTVQPDGYYPVQIVEVPVKSQTKIKKSGITTKKYNSMRKEKDFYQKKFKEIKNSRTWKVTKPVRLLGKVVKRKKTK